MRGIFIGSFQSKKKSFVTICYRRHRIWTIRVYRRANKSVPASTACPCCMLGSSMRKSGKNALNEIGPG